MLFRSDFSLPTLMSRWMYVQKQNHFALVVANLKIKDHPILYKTPHGYAWICNRGASLKWIRGLFDCKKFMMDLSVFNIAGESDNSSNRLASVERIVGIRQKARMGIGPQRPNSADRASYGNEDSGSGMPPGGNGEIAQPLHSHDVFTTPQLSKLLTHDYDDFKLDHAAIDLIIVDDQLDKVIKSVDSWIKGNRGIGHTIFHGDMVYFSMAYPAQARRTQCDISPRTTICPFIRLIYLV